MWERFFNWQSDQDWTWGPFVSLRPSRNVALRPWVWVRLFLIFTLIGIATLGAIGLLCLAIPFIATVERRRSPTWFTGSSTIIVGILSDHGAQNALIGLFFSPPLLFFAFCLPYHWAWNRRAERLSQADDASQVSSDINVWPPPPTRQF